MATRKTRRRKARRFSAGGTLLGFMTGLIVGLTIAVVVAVFVTRAPVPFLNKAKRTADRLEAPRNEAETPDPNAPLYSRSAPGPVAAPTPSLAAPSPVAPVSPAPPGTAEAASSYVLQAGAFRDQDDAEGMRAKLALIGYEARVVEAQVDDQPMFRVRVGPYADLNTMNDVRARLAQSGIEASVVRRR
ncbi:MAG: SPOR domain-containing protein [Burkholderiaceae bacterium]